MSRPRVASPSPAGSLVAGPIEAGLLVAAFVAAAGVALHFDLGVNRVFDVPKAVALKTLGGGAGLVWLLFAAFGPGVRWGAARVFAGPLLALTLVLLASTALSIDPATSLRGVYERQFGLQGLLACVGLYFVVSTGLVGRRAVTAGLALLALLGAMLGGYALLQRVGADPWPFFRTPHNKVYAFLGNATFAGNALALLFPVSTVLAAVELAKQAPKIRSGDTRALLVGFFGAMGLLVLIGYVSAAGLGPNDDGAFAVGLFQLGQLGAAFGVLFAIRSGSIGSPSGPPADRDFWDGVLAGALAAFAILIAVGIYATRTRGAWVGSGVAVALGLAFLPLLFRGSASDTRRYAALSYGVLGFLAVALLLFVRFSDSLAARTLRSIPAAFDPERTDFGKGQGTRPYLWQESIRVLTNHGDTLERQFEDREARAAALQGPLLDATPFLPSSPPSDGARAFEKSWRTPMVWAFGIGIETYRYAFMSHKSKRLEALDPMTNHDNPHNNYLYVLASMGILGLAAYLWLLYRLFARTLARFREPDAPWPDRALAFGVMTSFFSYAVYSIAGFDSVACSVFFYLMLGVTAVLLGGPPSEERRPLSAALGPLLPAGWAKPVSVLAAVTFGALLAHGALTGVLVMRAEQAFTGDPKAEATLETRVEDMHRAIRLSPHESFYPQSLGSLYGQAARRSLQQAEALEAKARTDSQRASAYLTQANTLRQEAARQTDLARMSLLAALDHAWAPENIYISLFQVLYALGKDKEAEDALERALRHSPHLGAVRANLAALQLARGANEPALRNARWVLEVDRKSALAFRTAGQVLIEQGELEEAAFMLRRARRFSPNDRVTQALTRRLEGLRAVTASATP